MLYYTTVYYTTTLLHYTTILYYTTTLLHYTTILYYTTLYYYTILYYTILYYTILYTILNYSILYYTILYYTILYLYYTILYCTKLHYTILYYTTILYSTNTLLYYTILYCTILYYTILYYTILYYTILYYTILYYMNCTLLYSTTLHYTALHYTTLHYTTLHYTTLHYTTRLDLMDTLTTRAQTAHETLFRWAQQQISYLPACGALPAELSKALRLLESVPVFHQHCMAELFQLRRLGLVSAFNTALSRGAPGVRPLELEAHDSKQFTIQLLRWIRRALEAEKEFFRTLCMPTVTQTPPPVPPDTDASAAQLEQKGNKQSQDNKDDENAGWREALSQVIDSLSRPVQGRIEQAVITNTSISVAFLLICVLQTEIKSLKSTLTAGASYLTALSNLQTQAEEHFFTLQTRAARKLTTTPIRYSADLSCPHSIADSLATLKEVRI
eukprot:g12146.t1